ncbi:phosphatidylcholine synthase [Monaibacterium marinum]|uniref:Phosphatidylcholine synthase n=1 Tax=Pontivivens marinum TaxID=1690039 RepID=A0A2C9CND3_9RHOB|nr:CDP-alcohol phosphatidyltransferase family protein [Monaibacterium marinum]SOH92695.1 phosphatidylcholine synthase [Monaibacterium marinum]
MFARAFSVHLLTATGAGLALMAMLAAAQENWPVMFLWLIFALLVDGIDGPLARAVDTKTNAPQWDGVLLDLIIDYLTYVFIPAYALVSANLIGEGWSLAAGLLICVSGVIYFADTRMKTSDNSFSGFPGCWNMVVLVLFAISPDGWTAMFLLIGIAIAQFLSLKFIHPVRTQRWRKFSLPVMLIWGALATAAAWTGFTGPYWMQIALVVTSVYLLLAGIAQQFMPQRA